MQENQYLSLLAKMSLLSFLSWSAIVATIGFFLSGILTCQKIMQSGNTENVAFLPLFTTLLNCMMWTSYGVLKEDSTVVTVNLSGALLQAIYIMCFMFYSRDRGKELQNIFFGVIAGVSLYYYLMHLTTEDEKRVQYLGYVCIVVTVTMQASPLAAVAKVLRTKSTESMPFPFVFMITIVSFIWLCYGTAVGDINIQIPNISGVLLGLIQLGLFCVYPSKPAANGSLKK